MKSFRNTVYNVIREDDQNKLSGTIFDSIIIAFITINIAFIILDTFELPAWYQAISKTIEFVAVIVFSIEYILRIWTAPLAYPDKKPAAARLKYMVSPLALIDLLSILPSYFPLFLPSSFAALRAMRIVRLLRVFKITRYNSALSVISRVFKQKAQQLFSSTLIVFILMLIASMLMYDIEHTAQPDKFDNAFSAFWWAISTVTTVGYGDLYPITTAGKIIGGIIAFLGIGLVAIPTGIISAGFVEESRKVEREHVKEKSAESPQKTHCPYCGNKLD